MATLKVGDLAPNFALQDETGAMRTLSEFKGKKLVIYFYPKDDTPGCVQEACSLRDAYALYAHHAISVVGINYDSVASHKNFKEKYHLPFILLTDADKQVAKAYGAYKGLRNIFFPQRMTFLIDEQGTVIHIFENIDLSTHAYDILKQYKVE